MKSVQYLSTAYGLKASESMDPAHNLQQV